ncbi:hypothetical protein E3T39_12555 [Cryobacterium suzukii]|uniref:Uncharacterized protein n=1 Tax=Cryobacterium suzukii TaxID=1259198 RepID=A0A4R9ADL4_9MICO|nr:hypothetical protein [Cryobacterium suzukii]TFD58131.1 hypothetical protein E3T39_12555 [Cryobacterium suzukii]
MRLARTRRGLRWTALLCAVALCAVSLSGCVGLRGGQSVDAAAERIEQLPGVVSAHVEQRSTLSGFARNWTTVVEVTLDSGYRIDDADAALDWVLNAAWSISEHEPTSGLWVGFLDSAGNAVDWDWAAASDARGYDTKWVRSLMPPGGVLRFAGSDIGDSLGSWPGDVPELADGVIVAD